MSRPGDAPTAHPDPASGPLRRLVRWVPIAVLLATAFGLWLLFRQGGLLSVTAWYLMQMVLPFLGACGLVGAVAYGVWRRRKSAAVIATAVASVMAMLPLLVLLQLWRVAYPVSLDEAQPAATVRLPADTVLHVAWGGDRVATNTHATTPDQRWAYDLVVAPFFSGSEALGDYGCYGVPVLAPAPGVVDVAQDGKPEAVPGRPSHNVADPLGNYVSIRLRDTGTFVILAHLQPGSVAVASGDTLAEGQPIGRCGNSGNTSEPHIHIHHQRQSPSEMPVGFAEGLPLYFRGHVGPAMPEGGLRREGDDVVLTGDVVRPMPP